jgi:hypothetical protein
MKRLVLFSLLLGGIAAVSDAQVSTGPRHARDRGLGVPASVFGTYIARGQLLIFPFVAYSRDGNREYNPSRLGFGLNQDFRGRFRSTQEQLFIGYGLSDRLAVEFEAGFIHARLDKAASDGSAMPARIDESGLADFEGQVRYRVASETDRRPEVFGYVEVTAPSQRRKLLIGDRIWDVRPGIGVVRGFRWGTLTSRVTVEYNHDDQSWVLGEFSIEYLRRLSSAVRVNFAIEGGETGAPDEWDLVSGVQWHLAGMWFLKFDNAIGLSSKATDWAPQIGIMLIK